MCCFRRLKDHHDWLHCSPLLKNTCVRRVGETKTTSNQTKSPNNTGVCEIIMFFTWALAMRPSSRNSNPAPDLVLWRPIFQCVLFSGGVFFHRHLYECVCMLRGLVATPAFFYNYGRPLTRWYDVGYILWMNGQGGKQANVPMCISFRRSAL